MFLGFSFKKMFFLYFSNLRTLLAPSTVFGVGDFRISPFEVVEYSSSYDSKDLHLDHTGPRFLSAGHESVYPHGTLVTQILTRLLS